MNTNDMPLDLDNFLSTMFCNPRVNLEQRNEPEPPCMTFERGEDGVWTLIFFGKCLGWVNRITNPQDGERYRAMSAISYNMERFCSLSSARSYLFSQSH